MNLIDQINKTKKSLLVHRVEYKWCSSKLNALILAEACEIENPLERSEFLKQTRQYLNNQILNRK